MSKFRDNVELVIEALEKIWPTMINYHDDRGRLAADAEGYQDEEGNTRLHLAVMQGDIHAVRYCMDRLSARQFNTLNQYGKTAMHLANDKLRDLIHDPLASVAEIRLYDSIIQELNQ